MGQGAAVSEAESRKLKAEMGLGFTGRNSRKKAQEAPSGLVSAGSDSLRRRARGFSLVEVNLAIFIVAIGLLTLFSLFPAGMKEGEAGHADTQAALFADYVLSTLRGNAASLTSTEWDTFSISKLWDGVGTPVLGGGPTAVEFPNDSKLYVRYILEIERDGSLYAVSLWVGNGEYGTKDRNVFKQSSEWYFTELFFSGMP